MEYLMFQRGVDAAATRERLGVITAYIADITEDDAVFRMEIKK